MAEYRLNVKDHASRQIAEASAMLSRLRRCLSDELLQSVLQRLKLTLDSSGIIARVDDLDGLTAPGTPRVHPVVVEPSQGFEELLAALRAFDGDLALVVQRHGTLLGRSSAPGPMTQAEQGSSA